MARLIATLPKGQDNGLGIIDQDMVNDPEALHIIVALVDCKKLLTDIDTGDVEPYARIVKIEAIEDDDAAAQVKHLMRAAAARRLGAPERTLVDEINDIGSDHHGIDPDTGEILAKD